MHEGQAVVMSYHQFGDCWREKTTTTTATATATATTTTAKIPQYCNKSRESTAQM